MKFQIPFILLTKLITTIKTDEKKPPNIIVIVIDDLGKIQIKENLHLLYTRCLPGWNDVSWNNPHSIAVRLGKYARYCILKKLTKN